MEPIDEAVDLFPHYAEEDGASPEEVDSAADDILRPIGMLSEVESDVDTSHRPVPTSTSGYLTPLLEDAPKDAKNRISKVLATSLVASGATRLFGREGIAAYDGLVDDLRTEYRERKAEILASDCGIEESTYPDDATSAERDRIDSDRDIEVQAARTGEIDGLISELRDRQEKYRADPLDAEAEAAATRVKEGPTDEMLVELFAAGALPSSTVDAFSDIEFRFDEPPSDLEDMSNEELAAYLGEHGELLDNEKTQKLVEERIEELSAEDGETDGTLIGHAGQPPATMTDTVEAFGNLSLVALYGKYAQQNGKEMPDAGADYLTALYEKLDKDDTAMDVVDWLGDSGYAEDWMTEAYANGLLEVSDPRLHDDFTSANVPDEVWDALEDIPKVKQETHLDWRDLSTYTEVSLTGGDGFRAFAELMSHASVEPGFIMADEMTQSVGELAGRIAGRLEDSVGGSITGITRYSGFDEALDTYGSLMQDVVEVASSNEEANEYLLHSADTSSEPDKSREYLTNLYTFPWPDDGKAVSGYTDWIAEYRASDDPEQVELANRASASFINVLTDTGDPNTFKTLMTEATPDQTYSDGEQLSVGDVNPELVQGFGLVVGSNLDALGNDVPAEEHGTVYEHGDGSITVTESDRGRLFTVIGTDETAATTLSTTIGAYEQARLDAAIESGDSSELQDVGAETNRLDGYMAAGLYNADAIAGHNTYESEMAAYEEHMREAAVGKAIVTGGLGAIPHAGSPISAGAGLLYDEIIKGAIEMPKAPETVAIPDKESDHFLRTVMAYEYVSAQLRAGHDVPAAIRDMLEDGKLPPIEDMGSTELSELDTHLADDEGYLDYVEKFEGSDPYDTTKIDGDPEGYLNGKD